MTVWIQKENNEPLSCEAKIVYRHCLVNRIPTRYFSSSQLDEPGISLRNSSLVVGSVEAMRKVFSVLDIKEPKMNYYPGALHHHMHRSISLGIFSDVIRTVSKGNSVFAKSLECKKLTGRVFDSSTLPIDNDISPYLPVWIGDTVDFVSEYRVYVKNHTIIACCHYTGDPEKIINTSVVYDSIFTLATDDSIPCAYAIDFGVLSNGKTALVEMNDAWAIGAYDGISDSHYYDFLKNRWLEIINSSKK